MNKKTVILGASLVSDRYSHMAGLRLLDAGHEIVPIGVKEGLIGDVEIIQGQPKINNVHTVTMYIAPKHQEQYHQYILQLKPKRVIFNPGTYNEELAIILNDNGIETLEACTLVLLSIGEY